MNKIEVFHCARIKRAKGAVELLEIIQSEAKENLETKGALS